MALPITTFTVQTVLRESSGTLPPILVLTAVISVKEEVLPAILQQESASMAVSMDTLVTTVIKYVR